MREKIFCKRERYVTLGDVFGNGGDNHVGGLFEAEEFPDGRRAGVQLPKFPARLRHRTLNLGSNT